eukprot:6451594-Amphidinium_carterae.1
MPAMSRSMHVHKRTTKLRLKRRISSPGNQPSSCSAAAPPPISQEELHAMYGVSMETAEEDDGAISICSTSEADDMEDSARTTITGGSTTSTSYYNQVTGTHQRILPSGQVVDMAAAPATA